MSTACLPISRSGEIAIDSDYVSAIRDLREKRIPHPTNQDFSEEAWRAGLSERALTSKQVADLLDIGLDLFRDLSSVRGKVVELEKNAPTGMHRGHACLIFTNIFDWLVETKQPFLGDSAQLFMPDFAAASELKGVSMNMRPTLTSFVEAVYDSLRLPIAHYARDQALAGKLLQRGVDRAAVEFGGAAHELASIYTCYEYIWGIIVWGGRPVRRASFGWEVLSQSKEVDGNMAVTRHLDSTESIRIAAEGHVSWNTLPDQVKLGFVPPEATISLRKGRLRVHWNWNERDIARPSFEWLSFQLITKRIPLSVVDLVMPADRISMSDALRVRSLLVLIGLAFQRELAGAAYETMIKLMSATISRREMEEGFSATLGWPIEKVNRCVELFVFKSARSEVWYQPLIEVGSDDLAFALHPLCFSSGARTIEWFLSRDQRHGGKKGERFEEDVFEYFASAMEGNLVVVTEIRHRLKTRNDIGDIDLLVRFHDLLLVIECKCISQPSTENDFYNRRKVIVHASEQVVRKTEYILKDVSGFMTRHSMKEAKISALVPLVCVSGNEFVGLSFDSNVWVVSKGSLGLVLGNSAPTVSEIDSDGNENYLVHPREQYADAATGARRLLEEIHSPRLIDMLKPYLQELRGDCPMSEEDGKKYEFEFQDVVFDDEAKARFLAELGVG